MNLNRFIKIVGVLVLSVTAGITAWAQVPASSEFWIHVSDDFAPQDTTTRYFGNHVNGTYGIDSLNPTIKEAEYPPPAFTFDARWANIPGRAPGAPGGMGLGIIPFDFRGTPGNATEKDTFKLAFVDPDPLADNATFAFQWPDSAYLHARCDSIFLRYVWVDVDGNSHTVKIDMFLQDTLTIPGPVSISGVKSLFIFKYTVRYIDAVRDEKSPIPTSFSLHQNYPNPFNPTTTISFDVVKNAVTDISVYNMLGQKIATLESQEFAPGSYRTEWNGLTATGRAAASGVYYVRMLAKTTGEHGVEQFSALRKLLLMK